MSGFKGEKLIVLPRDFLGAAASHALVSPLYPTDIGYFPRATNHYRERGEGCGQYILIFCAEGSGFLILDGRKKIIERNSTAVIQKGVPHIYGSNRKDPWSIFWVHFAGSNAPYYLHGTGTDSPVSPLAIEKVSKLKLMFAEMIGSLYDGYTYDSLIYVSQVLANVLGLIFFGGAAPQAVQTLTPVEEALRYMADHMNAKLKLESLAGAANLSKSQFSFLFREKTGFSPIDYFIRLKIHRACQYLDTTDLPVIEIAKNLGFGDPYYFSRAFHKIMNYSPSEYRKIKKG